MKLHAKLSTPLLIFFLSSVSIAQDLQLAQGKKIQTFKTGNLIKVVAPQDDSTASEECPNKFFVGRLISYKNNMISLRIRYEQECISVEDKKIGFESKNYEEKKEDAWPVVDIPANNIVSITKQGTKRWMPYNNGDVSGAVLITFGLIELAAVGIADGEDIQDELFWGLTLTATGIVMVSAFNRKTFYIENNLSANIGHKTWIIR